MSTISLVNSSSAITSSVPASSAKNTASTLGSSSTTTPSLETSSAYEQSQGIINLIHASSSKKTTSSMLSSLYSSSATLKAATQLSGSEFKKLQELNASSSVTGYTSQMNTLLSSLDTSSSMNDAAVTQNLLQVASSANELTLKLRYNPTGTLKDLKSDSTSGASVNLLA